MTEKSQNNRREAVQQFIESFGVPKWLVSGGITSVMALCLGVGIAGILYLFNLTSMVSVPLLLAAVVAVVAHPLVKFGDKIKLPRVLSSILVIFLILGIAWGTIQITFDGVISQAPAIGQQVTTGVNDLADYTQEALIGLGVPEETINEYMSQLTDGISGIFSLGATGTNGSSTYAGGYSDGYTDGSGAGTGLNDIGSTILQGAGFVGNFLSGLAGGIFSVFIFLVFLYYFLSDFERIRDWLSNNLFKDKRLGRIVINDITYSLSGYFRATTLTAVIVAVAIGIPLWIMGVPLIIPIIIVTVLTAYIPFLGAFIASAFTVLIALAAGGIYYALIAIVVMLIANNVLQTFVNNKLMGDYLSLHPLAVLIVTLLGTVVAGLLGGALGAPFLAIGIAIYNRVQKAKKGELTDEDMEERVHSNKELRKITAPLKRLFGHKAKAS
ncbi:MAG: AI-2E family transporter [Coriobacteriia bacterium]|nr:AI-2E family transporter [Coriobacteriia bacterium]MCL2746857.1 AI-2E family transporter [Coriobacteriia bacterium]MCL2870929.1 AI-2E family transporter [Coriobacteriia bacterium]